MSHVVIYFILKICSEANDDNDDDDYGFELCDIEEVLSSCVDKCFGCVADCRKLTFADDNEWYYPTKLETIFTIFSKIGNKKYILVAGNTAHGKKYYIVLFWQIPI